MLRHYAHNHLFDDLEYLIESRVQLLEKLKGEYLILSEIRLKAVTNIKDLKKQVEEVDEVLEGVTTADSTALSEKKMKLSERLKTLEADLHAVENKVQGCERQMEELADKLEVLLRKALGKPAPGSGQNSSEK